MNEELLETLRGSSEWLARWSKEQEDRALGWSFDEYKQLTARWGDTTEAVLAEVQFLPPPFGFAPPRMRAVVRITLDMDHVKEFPPQKGISLYEEDGRPFGDEKGWHLQDRCQAVDSVMSIWLEN
jgi:hypothetical protein